MSLRHITLKDFVIVRQLELDLNDGFTVLTGETGAGKSILIDALQFALGGKADTGLIRSGQSKTEVTAEFDVTPGVAAWLTGQDLEANDGAVLVRRTVDLQARGRGWINGTAATAGQLRELGGLLLDIHGQHAWQALMRPDTTRALLDGYGQIDLTSVNTSWREWKTAQEALAAANTHAAQHEARREKLSWHISELEKLAPGAREWEDLSAEHARLSHVHELTESASVAAETLSDADVNAAALITRASQNLAGKSHLEPQFAQLAEALNQACDLVADTARELHAYTRRTEADPARLAELDQRMANWLALAKRHHCSPSDLPGMLSTWQSELAELTAQADLALLAGRVTACRQQLDQNCKKISALRQINKEKLATEVTQFMRQLGMVGGRFEVQLTPLAEPQRHGAESVEFLVAGHAGVEPRLVGKVASGGELSRISLAIAVTTSQLGGCPTLIFDEVDAGVGGAVAHTVGQLMAQLGQSRQVLAVTHLPQVAACSHHHLCVSKFDSGDGVASEVTPLTPETRVQELARMLGGPTITPTTLAHARELLSA
ncbi:MAG TPA: DNA repair protein RecN [Burkholderiaceae bacterium]|nr:DNA repair protein RecN [Burkholderiaceae bacterium]